MLTYNEQQERIKRRQEAEAEINGLSDYSRFIAALRAQRYGKIALFIKKFGHDAGLLEKLFNVNPSVLLRELDDHAKPEPLVKGDFALCLHAVIRFIQVRHLDRLTLLSLHLKIMDALKTLKSAAESANSSLLCESHEKMQALLGRGSIQEAQDLPRKMRVLRNMR